MGPDALHCHYCHKLVRYIDTEDEHTDAIAIETGGAVVYAHQRCYFRSRPKRQPVQRRLDE